MQLKHIIKRTITLALALTLLLSLCVCDSQSAGNSAINAMEAIGISMAVVPGERLIDSPWINSDLENSIDKTRN